MLAERMGHPPAIGRSDVANGRVDYSYLHDHLGTTRMIVDASGHVCYDADYFPFGWEQSTPINTCAQNYKFTGKERDPNTGLDYFGARWYAGTIARFMTPDWSDSDPFPVPSADFENPQSLNLYSYVHNNPLSNVDPDGHDCVVQTRTSSTTETVSVSAGNCNNVSAGDGQTKTYVAGTVDTSSIKGDGAGGITFGYTPYSGGAGVADLSGAPIPDHPGVAYGWGNNAEGYQQLAAADKLVTDAAIVYGVAYGAVGGAVAGGEIAASTAAARSGIIFRMAHGMRLALGHSQVLADTGAVKNAIAAAIASGAIQRIGNGFQGVVNVAGTSIKFTGGWNAAGQTIVSNVMGAALQK